MTAEVMRGKRIGRPPGSRSAPPGLRAARWALRHLADEGAVAPSALAGRFLAMAREQPGQFAVVLDQLEAQERAVKGRGAGVAAQGVSAPLAGPASRRVRKLLLYGQQMIDYLRSAPLSWVQRLPPHRAVEFAQTRPGHGGGWVVTIEGPALSPVPEGQPTPEWRVENCLAWA